LAQKIFQGKPLWPWAALALVSGGITAAIAWEVWPRTLDLSMLRPRAQGYSASMPEPAEHVRMRLFLPHEATSTLGEEERDIPRRSVLAHSVRDVIAELARGGAAGTVAVLPAGLEVRQVYLDAFGILYLDFGERIRELVAGDANRAELAVSAIVLTFTTNFNEVKRVQLLSEGRELTARVGSVDLRRPLQPHFPVEGSQPIGDRPSGEGS
jgi:hypothetical protein